MISDLILTFNHSSSDKLSDKITVLKTRDENCGTLTINKNSGCYIGCYYYTDSCFRKDCKKEVKD